MTVGAQFCRSKSVEFSSVSFAPLFCNFFTSFIINIFPKAPVAFIIFKMTSSTVSSLLLVFLSCTQVFAQSQNVQYNQVLNVNGDVSIHSTGQLEGAQTNRCR